jgi:tRNA dimethylallyltransferase
LLQAWDQAAAAAGTPLQDLDLDAKWTAAAALVGKLGDPEAAARVAAEKNNYYRLQRVLQILLQNGGQPLSSHDIDTDKDLDFDFRCFFLYRPRVGLYDKIMERVEQMVSF